MGVNLAGSSDAYRPPDSSSDPGKIRIMAAGGAQVFADDVLPSDGNTYIGREVRIGTAAYGNTVIGNNVRVLDGVQGTVSVGTNDRTISESSAVYLGAALEYLGRTGEFRAANGALRANARTGEVRFGASADVNDSGFMAISGQGASVREPLGLRSRTSNGREDDWQLQTAVSEEGGPSTRDLVIRAADGTCVVFCAGEAQRAQM